MANDPSGPVAPPLPPSGGRAAALRGRVAHRLDRGGNYKRWVLVSALMGMFATGFPNTILAVSLGDIAGELDTSEAVLTWVISAPLLFSAVSLPILGKLGDLYGHRRMFLLGFTLATVTAALTALAWNAGSLIGFRTLSQVIGAATVPSSMALIMGVFTPEERVKALGWWAFVSAGSPTFGLVVGGPLVEAMGWRPLFLAQSVLAMVAVGVATLVLPETARKHHVGFDVPGAATLGLGVGGTMFALSQGVEWGWAHPAVIAALAVAPVGLALFLVVERRVAHPLLDLGLLRRRNIAAPVVSTFFSGATYMGGYILAPLLLRFVFGYSVSTTALFMVLRPLSFSLSSPVGGHLASRIGERAAAVVGTGLLGTALGLFAAGSFSRSMALVCGGLVLQGLGNGFSRPAISATMANAAGDGDYGIAAALQRMSQQVGAALGISILTAVYAGTSTPAGFGRAYLVGVVLGALALAAATAVRSQPREEGSGPGSGPPPTSATTSTEDATADRGKVTA